MSDDVTEALAEILACLSVGGDPTPHALRVVVAYVDSESKRIAAAREEQREACAREIDKALEADEDLPAQDAVRATPLDSTPLADENKALKARWLEALEERISSLKARAERAERDHVESQTNGARESIARKQAEAERDESVRVLRSLVSEVSWKLTRGENEPGAFEAAWKAACTLLAKHGEGA